MERRIHQRLRIRRWHEGADQAGPADTSPAEAVQKRHELPVPVPLDAHGWFSVGAGADLARGDVRPESYSRARSVLFGAGTAGRGPSTPTALIWGAHLGVGGRTCADGIVRPFHGWRFDGDGQLVEVPDWIGSPRGLRPACGPCANSTGASSSGTMPEAPRRATRSSATDSRGGRTPWRCTTYRVRVHVQDLTENIIDRSHFSAVQTWKAPDVDHFEVRFDGISMSSSRASR